MNRLGLTDEQIAEWLAACEAWARGGQIQWLNPKNMWIDCSNQNAPPPLTHGGASDFVRWRIKPEPVQVEVWAVVNPDGRIQDMSWNPANADIAKAYASANRLTAVKLTGEFTPP